MPDHFSAVAPAYAAYRPTYPDELFDWLAALPARRAQVWEAGCGSGQATRGLAARFARVLATDLSADQIAAAAPLGNAVFRAAPAHASGLAPGSVDLVAAAQALHWFDIPAFMAEARRVLAPGGAVAVWTYGNARLGDAALDALLHRFYHDEIGPWWPRQRAIVEDGYRSIPFPFTEIPAPRFVMTADLTLDALLGYIGTWSAVSRYRADRGTDPLPALRDRLRTPWGPAARARRVTWPLAIRAGR